MHKLGGVWRSAEGNEAAHGRCLAKVPLSELPPKYASLLGHNTSASHGERRAARQIAALRKHHGNSSVLKQDANSSALEGHIFYAVLTMWKNHATRCTTIKKTWGAHLPWDHLIFYSDRPEPSLPLNIVALAYPNLAASRAYDDAQDRFTYRIMPHAARRMAALNMSWLLWADDDTFVWPENLQHLLAPYDPTRWAWFGQACPLYRGRR